MSNVLARARVVATSVVTWLQVIAAVLVIAAEEIANAVPEISDDVTTVVVRVVAVLGAAIAIIRRVSPVLPDERGLLPAGGTPGDA